MWSIRSGVISRMTNCVCILKENKCIIINNEKHICYFALRGKTSQMLQVNKSAIGGNKWSQTINLIDPENCCLRAGVK